ncbi:MAG: hypothetical protein COA50_07980 [Flavobacteriaceae bacterium]|nr:MAG: hypothetical protein COA50_07980 [Flavobacteriaceae bacterium]
MRRNIQSELRPYLDNTETLLWTGIPKQGITLKKNDILMIPFSLMWGGFAFFWETSVLLTDSPLLFKLWGIPFVLVGCYMIFGRFIYDSDNRKKTSYGITENRILIKSGVFKSSVKSLHIKTLSNITLSEKEDGTGTITFGPENGPRGGATSFSGFGVNKKMSPSLEMIKNVRKVYMQITELQRN